MTEPKERERISKVVSSSQKKREKRFLQFLLPVPFPYPFLFPSFPPLSPHKETRPKDRDSILIFSNYPVLPDQPHRIPPSLARLLSRSLFLAGTGTISSSSYSPVLSNLHIFFPLPTPPSSPPFQLSSFSHLPLIPIAS